MALATVSIICYNSTMGAASSCCSARVPATFDRVPVAGWGMRSSSRANGVVGDRTIPSRETMSYRKPGGEVPSLQAVRASSRTTRVHAAEESTTSDTAAEEVKGGGGECPGCGKAEKLGGCNGEGRIQGGIGAVPGFGWLPIKAFRPCPAFIETGGRYRRIGQSLEEVAFGRKGAEDDVDISERLKG